MAAVAQRHADQIVVTSDNPRSESADSIVAQILLGFTGPESVRKSPYIQIDRALAIAQTIAKAKPQDVVLLAGKGHETTQEINGIKHPFDDQIHARAALLARVSEGVPSC